MRPLEAVSLSTFGLGAQTHLQLSLNIGEKRQVHEQVPWRIGLVYLWADLLVFALRPYSRLPFFLSTP